MNRRRALQYISGSIALSSGCAQLSDNECDEMQKTTVDLENVTLTEKQLPNLYPITHANLSDEHKRIIQIARNEERYESCPPVSNKLESFIHKVEDRINEQWEDYDAIPDDRPDYLRSAYLELGGSYFEFMVTVEDFVVSG